ncbi:GntR family transcriptional regulator [Okibacterium endophyticum]
MDFSIDPASPVPPFEQVRTQILAGVQSGDLVPGHKLPPVRALASDLGLAVNTVARAYRELEADDVIETRGRNGSFIATTGDPTLQKAQMAAMAYAERITQLGIDSARGLALVRAALGERD